MEKIPFPRDVRKLEARYATVRRIYLTAIIDLFFEAAKRLAHRLEKCADDPGLHPDVRAAACRGYAVLNVAGDVVAAAMRDVDGCLKAMGSAE